MHVLQRFDEQFELLAEVGVFLEALAHVNHCWMMGVRLLTSGRPARPYE